MCLFARNRHKKAEKVELLPLDKIVEIMYNKNLSFADEIVDVIYSHDKTKRYVILKNTDKNFYTFVYEKLDIFDEDELRWMRTDSIHPGELLPASWTPYNSGSSLFGTLEEAVKSMRFEPEYKQYFNC